MGFDSRTIFARRVPRKQAHSYTATVSIPCVLVIGGTDPSGGAGVSADARACAAFGAHALPIITAVVAQNTGGVKYLEAVSPDLLSAQLDNLLSDIAPQSVKTGLIPNFQAVEIIAACVKTLNVPLIVDPVFAPSTGHAFSNNETISAFCELLLPHAEIYTPNWLEAEQLLGEKIEDAEIAARELQARFGARAVLLKGGHAPQNSHEVTDYFFDGTALKIISAPRFGDYEVRGTGCMLASAIAAQRAQNIELVDAIKNAKQWITKQIQNAQPIGKGRRVAVQKNCIS